jgi:hypothetical protein
MEELELGLTFGLIALLKLSVAAAPPVPNPNSVISEDYIIDHRHTTKAILYGMTIIIIVFSLKFCGLPRTI